MRHRVGVVSFQDPAVCLGKKASRDFPNRGKIATGEMKFFTVTYVHTYDGKSYTARLPYGCCFSTATWFEKSVGLVDSFAHDDHELRLLHWFIWIFVIVTAFIFHSNLNERRRNCSRRVETEKNRENWLICEMYIVSTPWTF